MKRRQIKDTVVIYRSSKDRCWVAHSLRTDQIGTGRHIIEALADGIKAVQQVLALAHEDESIEPFREAPPEIRKMAERAKPLPGEVYEIACKMARGEWPQYLEPDFTPHGEQFKAEALTAA
jgi:hypothetical protein